MKPLLYESLSLVPSGYATHDAVCFLHHRSNTRARSGRVHNTRRGAVVDASGCRWDAGCSICGCGTIAARPRTLEDASTGVGMGFRYAADGASGAATVMATATVTLFADNRSITCSTHHSPCDTSSHDTESSHDEHKGERDREGSWFDIVDTDTSSLTGRASVARERGRRMNAELGSHRRCRRTASLRCDGAHDA
jgi:hypothetical protein